jgi:lambda repressor-like predicted transcriptional regulator
MGIVRQTNRAGGLTMKKTVKMIGITAALVVMIPFSAYAATTSGTTDTDKTEKLASNGLHIGHGGFGIKGDRISQEVLDLLNLNTTTYQEKVEEGLTLAEIAEAQGVTRDSLKSVLTAEFDKKQVEQKAEYTANLDNLLDGDLQLNSQEGFRGGFHGVHDYTEAASLLGLTVDEVKAGISEGKSLADLAEEKGVDVQTLIDAQIAATTAIINQAVTDGKLTQEQADNQLVNVAAIAERIINGTRLEKGQHGGSGKGRGFGGETPAETESVED